jgi:heme exporter protein B
MNRWCRQFLVLLYKEIALEARGKELLVLLGCSSIIVAVLVGAGVSSAVLDSDTTRKVFPMLLWVVFLLTATTASVRANEAELEGRGFEGLLLAGVSGPQLYLSKVCVTALVLWIDWVLLMLLLGAVLDQSLGAVFQSLCFIGMGASLVLAALLVLLSGVTGTSRMRGVLLPLVTLPLLFPLFFAGVELTSACVLQGNCEAAGVWPSVMGLSGLLFLLVGINTYELAVRE